MDTTILAGIADYEGAIERAIKTALTILTEARTAISILPGSIYLEAMQSVAGYLEGLLQSCRQ